LKRLAILICALCLLLDIADDGFIGKVPIVSQHSPVKSLEVYSDPHGSAESTWQTARLPSNVQYPPKKSPVRTITPVIKPVCKIIFSSHQSSAGGLPG
jgi:hypothetical protein